MISVVTWGFKVFLFLSLFSCLNSGVRTGEISNLSDNIRLKYKKKLIPLKDINYYEMFGRIPSEKELELGRLLFNDPILSRNNDVSCATCHLTNHGFADGNFLNIGSGGKGGPHGFNVGSSFGEGTLSIDRSRGDDGFGFRPGRRMFRNSLSTLNVAYRHDPITDTGLLWDGRFGNLFFQVLLPIHTPEEMCGQNPLPLKGINPFRKGGEIFKEAIELSHTNFSDSYTGANSNLFNYQNVKIMGVERYRKNGQITYPNRNECLAITLGKLNSIQKYKTLFKDIYKQDRATDKTLGIALAAFVSSHVSKNTPYDQFLKGKNALNKKALYGLEMFFSDYGAEVKVKNGAKEKKLQGAGCISCHTPPTFDSKKFYSLGVKSESESILTRPQSLGNFKGGFFFRNIGQRGKTAKCHIEGVSVLSNTNYAPDIGRAHSTSKDQDCFKFRVPTLRNVVETYPYFHHGTERGQGVKADSFTDLARASLRKVIGYHLRGAVDLKVVNSSKRSDFFFDEFFQFDPLIPFYMQDFDQKTQIKARKFSDEEIDYLLEFVVTGLWDKDSTKTGGLNNDVSHPTSVPSGLLPTITRDEGKQTDFGK